MAKFNVDGYHGDVLVSEVKAIPDDHKAFVNLVLTITGGGMTAADTAAAMQLNRTLADLQVGQRHEFTRDDGQVKRRVVFTRVEG